MITTFLGRRCPSISARPEIQSQEAQHASQPTSGPEIIDLTSSEPGIIDLVSSEDETRVIDLVSSSEEDAGLEQGGLDGDRRRR